MKKTKIKMKKKFKKKEKAKMVIAISFQSFYSQTLVTTHGNTLAHGL